MTKEEITKIYEIIDFLEGFGLPERIVLELRNWILRKVMDE